MEGDGFNAPDPGPLDGAALFLRETLTRLAGLTVHGGEHMGIQISLIERGFTPADHCGDDTGKCLHGSNRADRVRMFFRNGPDFEGELGCDSKRIAPFVHGGGAGMRLLSMERDGMTLHTFRSQDDAERESKALEDWALFNVEFQVGGGVRLLFLRFGEA